MAPLEYWNSIIYTKPIDITKFHQVIVTQNNLGLVAGYVTGIKYGSSYAAIGGKKNLTQSHPASSIKICGDNDDNIGFDGYIRAFGFYTQSFNDTDAINACYALDDMVECDTATPTMSPITGNPTISPVAITSNPTMSPATPITITTTPIPITTTIVDENDSTTTIKNNETENEKESNWIIKDGVNCADGFRDLELSNFYYGIYCEPCPDGTAGTYGICEECGTLQAPHSEQIVNIYNHGGYGYWK